MTTLEKLLNIVGNGRTLDTLGGRKKFKAQCRGSRLIITPSSGKQCRVTEEVARRVEARFVFLLAEHKYEAGHYVRPRWQDCPNNILSPYIARILKEGE